MLVMLINIIVKMVIWKNRFIYLRIYIVNYVILFMYVVKGIFVRWILMSVLVLDVLILKVGYFIENCLEY